MIRLTESEAAFERYCTAAELNWLRVPQNQLKSADYCIISAGTNCWIEVKEFNSSSAPQMVRTKDALAPIRLKVARSYSQLKQHANGSRCLVLFSNNPTRPLTSLHILSSMYGRVIHQVSAEHSSSWFDPPYRFTRDRTFDQTSNTLISAIIILEEFGIAPAAIRAARIAADEGRTIRELGATAYLSLLCRASEDVSIDQFIEVAPKLRCRVFQNPNASIQLPDELFTGPRDVKWAGNGDIQEPIFLGADLKHWMHQGVPVGQLC